MSFVRGLLDRVLLIGAVVVGGLVPGFIAQYRQRLGGRLDQARVDLEAWQRVADQFQQGDLEKLIQYHLNSSDATFRSEGMIIRSLLNTVQQLQAALEALHSSLFRQASYLAVHADAGIARATLDDWVPTFALTAEALVFALLFAGALWLLFHALWRVVAAGARGLAGRYGHQV